MLQICIITIAGLFTVLILKKDKPEYAALIVMLVSFLIAIKVLDVMEVVLEEIRDWSRLLQGNMIYIQLLLKMIGITYLCEFAANLCKDAGNAALGNHIELFGKVMIMAAGIPVMKQLLELLAEVLK